MADKVNVELRLPTATHERAEEVARLAGVKVETVYVVLLALYVLHNPPPGAKEDGNG